MLSPWLNNNRETLFMWVVGCVLLAAVLGYVDAVVLEPTLPLRRVDKSSISLIKHPTYAVIDNQRDWDAHWHKHSNTGLTPVPPPVVDFNREFLVIAHWGRKPYPSYRLSIDSIKLRGRTFTVNVQQTEESCSVCATMGVSPSEIVALSRSNLAPSDYTVEFRESSRLFEQPLLATSMLTVR